MPNWCSNKIEFIGSKEEILNFENNLREWTVESPIYKSGTKWLGNYLIGAGLDNFIDDMKFPLSCRGELLSCEINDSSDTQVSLTLETETAWVPHLAMWEFIIKKMGYNTIKFTAFAEECGCGLYYVYDPHELNLFTDEEYVVDSYLYDENDTKFSEFKEIVDITELGLLSMLQKVYKTAEPLETLIKRANEEEFESENSYLCINKVQFSKQLDYEPEFNLKKYMAAIK